MKRILETLKKRFIVTREEYEKAKYVAREENNRNLKIFSIIGFFIFVAVTIVSFFNPVLDTAIAYYISAGLMAVCIILSFFVCPKHPSIMRPVIYLFMGTYLAYGILQGTIFNPDDLTVSFIVWMFTVAFFFTERPIFANSAIVISVIVYIVLAKLNQTEEMFSQNIVDVGVYAIISLALCSLLMKYKFNKILLQIENQELVDYDQLTGLGSYSNYSKQIKEIKNRGTKEVIVISLDVNGLKQTNDTHGHVTGDELIISAAKAIKESFDSVGKCFRNGGDEFTVIVDDVNQDVERAISDLRVKCVKHVGIRVNAFSLSIGQAKGPSEEIERLIVAADKDMYADKKQYYVDTEDRRFK